ncbi:Methyltransferase domain protein [Variovorax sp. SRS16]|uniref:class I SAM-dependent methyltransferase n=1 Tax=Variovorax sp. SRS16 TaxID=282217 RepID=UPI001316C822|nr:class I SAM-dependent methyltransferase [Variovorax sp. SRS16]VTU20372.1 Methyltransferase domain protein [Variovorax sp. SRS16]
MRCSVCGGQSFTAHPVLWPALINEWQLSDVEAAYIDRQQGETCNGCGSNLRSISLSDALLSYLGFGGTLRQATQVAAAQALRLLELNEAGNLSPVLRAFGGYAFGAYPEVDMHSIPFADETFDVVVHSDTLEHVPHPVHALAECRRVLKRGGALCFTVPIIVGRMSRDRSGLSKSFHGSPATAADDYAVQTEFGADAWTYVMQAGFTKISIHALAYPAAIAFAALKD